MAKTMQVIKTIQAGCITERPMYTRIERGDSAQARAAKKECSTQARKLSNHRTLQRSLYFTMATNFKLTDFFLTLTFDDRQLPTRRKEVMQRVDKFVRHLRKHRLLRGQDMRYIYCIESKHGDGRYHVHMVLNSTGQDVEAICSLWDGGFVDWEYIGWTKNHGKLEYRGDKGYKVLARYMTKEIQPVGARSYSGSKNLARPTVTISLLPDNEVERRELFKVPEDAKQTEYQEFRNEWGLFRFISFYRKTESAIIPEDHPSLYEGEDRIIFRGPFK